MKRLMTVVITLLLCVSCASAETLREQTGAPDQCRERWTSASVPMQITIDAPVEVPDAAQAFRVAVTRHEFTSEEIGRVSAALLGAAPEGLAYENIWSGWYEDWRCRAQSGEWRLEGRYEVLRGQRLSDTLSMDRRLEGVSMGNSMSIWRPRQAHQNPYTPQAAQKIADDLVARIAPDRVLTGWGTEEIIPDSAVQTGAVDTQTEFPEWPELYIFCYTPVIGGIPERYTDSDCVMDEESTYFPFRCDRLYVLIAPDGLCGLQWQAPEDFGEQTSCTLLPFDEIMNVARELLPLSQVDAARRFGNEACLMVNRITLSYCRVRKWNTLDEYELVPVWDFFGFEGRTTDEGQHYLEQNLAVFPGNVLLTINAIDGLVIDRSYGY